MCYHPSRASSLLSGSTDGLVNILDTTIADEDDSLIEVFNHEASIHHAGFLTDTDVYALSHDEQLSIYHLTSPDERESSNNEPYPIVFGDMRARVDCEYVVDIATSSGSVSIAAGSHSTSTLDLIPLHHTVGWELDMSRTVRLLKAHDDEIVRTIYIDGQVSNTIPLPASPRLTVPVQYNIHRRGRRSCQSLEARRGSEYFRSHWAHENQAETR